jgi:transposase, IS30 family
LRNKGYSYKDIGNALSRSKSALWTEVTRNTVKSVYNPKKATHKAYVRRYYAKYQRKKIVENDTLRTFVDTHLLLGQSPEAISGRLRSGLVKSVPYVSKESIYRYIHSIHGRRIEAKLRTKKRRKLQKRCTGTLDGRTFIDKRPKSSNTRLRIGDAEFDFIVSGKGGKGILLVVVDRKLRVVFIEPIYKVTLREVHAAARKIKRRYPEWHTGTTDNDLLFRRHKELETEITVKIFFCHPYHSWEKGTVENTNGEIRRYFPKGSDVSKYPPSFFSDIEKRLNERFMNCLQFRTPYEALARCRIQKEKRDVVRRKRMMSF